MALKDKSGGWHGKLGNVVYLVRDAKQLIRDYVKGKDPKTARQLLHRELMREVGRLHIAAMIANAAIRGITITEKNSSLQYITEDFYRRLVESNELALSCGWLTDEPMLLYADDRFLGRKHLNTAAKEEIVWANVIGDKICALAFVPGAPRGFFRLAMRIKSRLAYRSANSKWLVADALEIEGQENQSPDSLEQSLAGIPEFCKEKANEFILERRCNSSNELARKMRKGFRFVYFCLTQVPVPVNRFGVEYVQIADLSGGKIHLLIDLVGMTRLTRDGLTLYQCVRSKPPKAKSDYIIELPQRRLGKFGETLAERLYKQGRAYRKKYFSNPAKRAADNERRRELRRRYPENGREYSKRRYEKIKQDPVKHVKNIAYQRKWRREHPEKVKEYNERRRKKVGSEIRNS